MTTILNRTTLNLVQVANISDLSRLGPSVSEWIINPDLSAVGSVPKKYWKLTGDFITEMSQPEKDVVDATNFSEQNPVRYEAIDSRTSELIAQGFAFPPDGYIFSLSMESQANIHGIFTARNLEGVTYPIHLLSLDEQGSVNLQNATDVEAFFLTAVGTIRALKDSGAALKDQVTASTTVEGLRAIVGNR